VVVVGADSMVVLHPVRNRWKARLDHLQRQLLAENVTGSVGEMQGDT